MYEMLFTYFIVHFLLAQNPAYFLCLETKKVSKENSLRPNEIQNPIS
jgi:hypothetical protein